MWFIIRTVIYFLLLFLFTLASIKFVKKIDPNSGIMLDHRHIISLALVSVLVCIALSMFFEEAKGFHILLVMGFLIVMSFTDLQTGMVYTILSLVLALTEILIFLLHIFKDGFPVGIDAVSCVSISVSLLLIFAAGKADMLGMGDVYIFFVLALFYCNTSKFPLYMLMVNLFLASMIFLIGKLPFYFRGKCSKKRFPFTSEIASAAFITILLFR